MPTPLIDTLARAAVEQVAQAWETTSDQIAAHRQAAAIAAHFLTTELSLSYLRTAYFLDLPPRRKRVSMLARAGAQHCRLSPQCRQRYDRIKQRFLDQHREVPVA